jgi:hypothetical protein
MIRQAFVKSVFGVFLSLAVCGPFVAAETSQANSDRATHVQTRPAGPFLFDDVATFPIGFTKGPPTGATTPDGQNAMATLRKEAYTFQLWYCPHHQWGKEKEEELDALFREANRLGMHVVISIADLQHIKVGDAAATAELKRVVMKYRDEPSLLFWKGEDEPQWGKIPPEDLRVYYETIHELDPNHPIWITHAPRGTASDWKPYSQFMDIGAVDIYPIGYPPGMHSGTSNRDLSVVGDYAQEIRESLDYRKPTMMILQICWSGVTNKGRTLRFPTFPDERYMTYQSIIDGARGLVYFGGSVAQCLNESDAAYGWNWTFYDRVLRPVLDELKPDGPLYPALIAPDSKLKLSSDGAKDMDFTVREAGEYIYLLASRRDAETAQVSYSGLPAGITDGEVLFESPRHVTVTDGKFTDWFGPHEVHVYRFRLQKN